ncbi:CRISPR-associated protein Cas4 [Marinilactibacillus sp. 15R]|uniref:CRISPR-associated exonuclease Cas4 n=1 Tax=Marinilactibacillus piezotolerans TaxID=258723 RepID=A0A1I3VY61_9LACT|nr:MULTISPECIES: CRISPR-associated protein Cas4 [Marinilactibacillus]API87830.1 CRISPR-associated protein Cas4 [Marinilactibacillus sp. 15R]SFK00155.1 CRISPR-associated exonuclease, Cas4 family [Marinilactibacillus piezotolerans]
MDSNPEEFLMLSGIQHFKFCPRQWALIHIEQQWEENIKTIQGNHLHRNADQPFMKEKRGHKLVTRSMHVQSKELRITGICDVVELVKDKDGVFIPKLNDVFRVIPIEYKRGKPKKDNIDILQLTAQAICLEEMLLCEVDKGYIYYNEIRNRQEIEFTDQLRGEVRKTIQQMQELYSKKHTPKVKTGSWCKNCSLQNICLPRLMQKESVSKYIERKINE